jgi:hypothetical protein
MIKLKEHELEIQADPIRLKVIAEALCGYMDRYGIEDQTLRDFRFQMEVAYQNHHSLDQDDWRFTDWDWKQLTSDEIERIKA